MELSLLFLSYLTTINVLLFILMGFDKRQAVKRNRRISEKNLWLIAWIGGAAGGYLGMEIFRHKTKHRSFKVGMPVLIAIQVIVLLWYVMV
ncbi:hypothetical protein GCM10010954_01000 [Halobacillus andaensis]|uniref:DUF1294 domain-containing protein n=1 Tax=Halobacillus andaensis TaxID=1176239 RepID=A0A917AY86_HALAA|nr:DUF1294 domain-containing protein [Halobacillus andaensis]MBP2002888.1 uncharacterized membrane protein YsdA (DUF1294 family) [Halobacillus andaensis]GGF06426.1 hypothetical protein GCM10010954_01000 [Halobacillus andaensis]